MDQFSVDDELQMLLPSKHGCTVCNRRADIEWFFQENLFVGGLSACKCEQLFVHSWCFGGKDLSADFYKMITTENPNLSFSHLRYSFKKLARR